MSNWTNVFADKFHEINDMCVLKFNYYRLKYLIIVKVICPFFRARAECKFDNCRVYIFYIEDEVRLLNNGIVVKFYLYNCYLHNSHPVFCHCICGCYVTLTWAHFIGFEIMRML